MLVTCAILSEQRDITTTSLLSRATRHQGNQLLSLSLSLSLSLGLGARARVHRDGVGEKPRIRRKRASIRLKGDFRRSTPPVQLCTCSFSSSIERRIMTASNERKGSKLIFLSRKRAREKCLPVPNCVAITEYVVKEQRNTSLCVT